MLKTLASLVLMSAPAHASVTQPRPETDTKQPIRTYRIPKACDDTKPIEFIRFNLMKLVEGKLVTVGVVLVPKGC